MSKPEGKQGRRLPRLLLRWGIPLTLLVACSEPNPVELTQDAPQPAPPPSPALAFKLPAANSALGTAGIETRAPEEVVASQPPVEQAKTVINFLGIALFAYRCHTGRYPTQQQALRALIERPLDIQPPGFWQGPYSPETFLTDPWGKPYEYRWLDGPKVLFDLRSLGPDGVESKDDLTLAQLSATEQFAHRDYVEHFTELYSRQRAPGEAFRQLLPSPSTD